MYTPARPGPSTGSKVVSEPCTSQQVISSFRWMNVVTSCFIVSWRWMSDSVTMSASMMHIEHWMNIHTNYLIIWNWSESLFIGIGLSTHRSAIIFCEAGWTPIVRTPLPLYHYVVVLLSGMQYALFVLWNTAYMQSTKVDIRCAFLNPRCAFSTSTLRSSSGLDCTVV